MTPSELEHLACLVADKLAKRPRLVDRVELRSLLGVGESTLDRLTKRGEIPSIRVGRRVLFDPDAVIAALTASEAHRPPQKIPGDTLSPVEPGGES